MDPDPFPYNFFESHLSSPPVISLILLGVGLVLTYLSAIISGSEVAFFSLNKEETEHIHLDTNPKAVRLSNLLHNPKKLLITFLISSNLLNILVVVILIFVIKSGFHFFLVVFSPIVEALLLAIFVLFIAEILPKTYASQKPLNFALNHVTLVSRVYFILKPLSLLLVNKTSVFNESSIDKKYEITMDNLTKALELSSNEVAHDKEKNMLEGIIRFRDKTVEDILVSRADMVSLDIETVFTEVIKFIVGVGFSRIPVYEESPDNIKGILYVKDLLSHLSKDDNFRWQTLIRPAYFVPGTKRIDDLLEEFRANKNHMAVVVDEYGGTTGIVTMEDILEEIVGDISDEYDEDEKPLYVMNADGSYIFEGKTTLEDFVEITGVPPKDFEKIQEEADTLAGLMLELKGDFPIRKELIEYSHYGFQAEELNKRRIIKIKFIPNTSKLSV